MRRTSKQPYVSRSWTIALLIGLIFLALEVGLRFEIEGTASPAAHSWLDLVLLLVAYVFIFCLKPLQVAIQRKLRRRAFRNHPRKIPS